MKKNQEGIIWGMMLMNIIWEFEWLLIPSQYRDMTFIAGMFSFPLTAILLMIIWRINKK